MRDENQLARGGGGTHRAGRCADQIFHRAELVSRATRRASGGIYNFVTKRGLCKGQQLEDFLDAGRDRLGHHLEISELHFAGRQFRRRILFRRGDEQLSAGRHRHEDGAHRQKHAQHDCVQGHLGRTRPEQLSRPGEDPEERRERAQFLAVRFDADRRSSAARTRSRTSK